MTELEELQQLRVLVEKQKLELEKQQVKIEKQQEELEKKDEIIRKKEIQIEHMIQALLHAKKKLFGRSSEVTEGQLCLFETNQQLAEQLSVEQKKVAVKSYQRTPSSTRHPRRIACWHSKSNRRICDSPRGHLLCLWSTFKNHWKTNRAYRSRSYPCQNTCSSSRPSSSEMYRMWHQRRKC